MENIDNKIEKLKEYFINPSDQSTIDDMERSIRKNIENEALLEHEIIKSIVESAEKDIEIIDGILANDKSLNDKEAWITRRMLFEKREWIKFYILDRFGSKAVKEKKAIIERKIEEYYNRIK